MSNVARIVNQIPATKQHSIMKPIIIVQVTVVSADEKSAKKNAMTLGLVMQIKKPRLYAVLAGR